MQAVEDGLEKVANTLDIEAKLEETERKKWRISRHKEEEVYYVHCGRESYASLKTIWRSHSQMKLFILGFCWYVFQMAAYAVLANILIWVTFNQIPPSSPSYPGESQSTYNGTSTFFHDGLYDLGFFLTPDRSDRPFWLKAVFVDMMVTIAQVVPPIILVVKGQTQNFICYAGLLGVINICKGIVQMATVLPPARGGQECWLLNFNEEEILAMKLNFGTWWWKSWGMTRGCNDMLWSGHSAQSCLGILFIDKHLRQCHVIKFFRFFLLLYYICYIGAVLACRMHYSIDVLIGTAVSVTLFTHSPLRFWIWGTANFLVCNDPFEKDTGELQAEAEDSDSRNVKMLDESEEESEE
jgi:hypothetical protein